MKLLVIIFLTFFSTSIFAQNYVDLLNVTYGKTGKYKFKDKDGNAVEGEAGGIKETNVQLVIPVPVTDDFTFVTGIDYIQNDVTIAPDYAPIHVYFARFKLGFNADVTDRINLTGVVLPKVASNFYEYRDIDVFQIGGLFQAKYKLRDNFYIKGGLFGSSEVFGLFVTPLIGFYYKGPGEKFEVDFDFPRNIEASYAITNSIKLGVDFYGIVTSYKLAGRAYKDGTDTVIKDLTDTYLHRNEQEFSAFAQVGFFQNLLLLRAKLFYKKFDYGFYSSFDNLPLEVMSFELDDKRTRLNPEFDSGGIGLKLQAIVRFDLSRLDK